MIDEVDILFNYRGSWVISPKLVYIKKLVHSWRRFDPELLSHKDICDEFTLRLGLSQVKQLLVTGPSGKYYIVDGDSSIRDILSLLCDQFKVINFFVVEEGELTVFTEYITHYTETDFINIEVGTDCEHSASSCVDFDLSEGEEYYYEGLEAISKERGRIVSDRLKNYKELYVGKGAHFWWAAFGWPGECDGKIDEPRKSVVMGTLIVNLIHYPVCPSPEFTAGAGHHADVSSITMLLQDDVGGLYVREPKGDG
ncbi:hypothetical protein BC332_18369 [Capsicum chinense]|nr:hypothetical protein BC332_18369 [Capsicum chinense]